MIALWLWSATASAGIVLEQEATVGVEVVVEVTDAEGHPRPGETVRVLHRPGLTGEREFAIGITDGRGKVRWTPELPGVADLGAGDEHLDLSVARVDAPTASWTLLGLLALAGVAALGFGLLGERRR
jgi:hypothetical protein